MCGDDYVGCDFAYWRKESYSPAPKETMKPVTEEGSHCVTGEGREEYKGGDEVRGAVVRFNLEKI